MKNHFYKDGYLTFNSYPLFSKQIRPQWF